MKRNKPKVVIHWQPVAGEPSPLWRRLWARLLQEKKQAPPTAGTCETPSGKEEEKSPGSRQ